MGKALDITGNRYGRLTAVRRVQNRGRLAFWLFTCDCGGQVEVWPHSVKRGLTQSCGCLHREPNRRTHGRSGTSEFWSWSAAKGRCTNPRNAARRHYGGRGILMHQAWLDDFGAFYRDMGPRPKGMSLDRIDNDRGYEPGNCRWATSAEQVANRRNAVLVEHEGRTLSLKQFSVLMGVSYGRLHERIIGLGETPQEAAAKMRARLARRAP